MKAFKGPTYKPRILMKSLIALQLSIIDFHKQVFRLLQPALLFYTLYCQELRHAIGILRNNETGIKVHGAITLVVK